MTNAEVINSLYNNYEIPKTTQQIVDELLGISTKPKEEDTFKDTLTIPMGTLHPFNEYIDDFGVVNIPENHVFTLSIKPDDIYKGISISDSGTHKTWQIKNKMFYFNSNKFKIAGIDAKGYDMIGAKYKPSHNPTRLHPKMLKASLPIYGLLPAFALNRNYSDDKLSDNIVEKYDKIFSFPVSSITSIDELENLLGISVLGGMTLIQWAQKTDTIKELYMKIKTKSAEQSRKSLVARFEQAMLDEIFTNDFTDVDLEKLWLNNKIPVVSFFNRNRGYIRFYVNKLLKRLKNISERNSFKNLIILEDASSYLNKDFQRNNVAVDTVLTGMTDWRSFGFNFEISIQNPSLIDDKILSECNHFFIGTLVNPDALRSYMSGNIIDDIKDLNYDDTETSNKLVQYAYYRPGMKRALKYYPFQPVVYHPLS